MNTLTDPPVQTRKTVETNGLHIYYEECGSGIPLILLHGGLETCQMWTPMLPDFSSQYRVITPDSRGHGRTDNPLGTFSYSLMSADIAAFIKESDLSKPFIIGYSDGGQIALEMAMNYPGLVRGYMLGGIYLHITEAWRQFINFQIGIEKAGFVNTDRLMAANLPFVESMQEKHDSFHFHGYWKTLLQQISLMWTGELNFGHSDFAKIVDPVLFFCGDRDVFCPPSQNLEMYQKVKGAELAVIPNADHFSIQQEWDIVQKVLNDFMARMAATA
jgi:pimeloyl-ACP methyl ester carboxylesterase